MLAATMLIHFLKRHPFTNVRLRPDVSAVQGVLKREVMESEAEEERGRDKKRRVVAPESDGRVNGDGPDGPHQAEGS